MTSERIIPLHTAVRERYGNTTDFLAVVDETLRIHGLSRRALALRAGYDPSQITRWLNGHTPPSLESCLTIDEALHHLVHGVPEGY